MAPLTIRDVNALIPKFENSDPDIRFMSLADLCQTLESSPLGFLAKEPKTSTSVIDAILKLLDDTNGDVQSQALKCIGPLASRCPPELLPIFIEELSCVEVTKSKDVSIPPTATRYMVVSFPRPIAGVPAEKAVEDAYDAVSRVLIPRLLGRIVNLPNKDPAKSPDPPVGMLEIDPKVGANVDAIDLLSETVRCFGPLLKDSETEALLKKVMEIIDSDATGNIGKKKAVAVTSILALHLSDRLLNDFVSTTIGSFQATRLVASKRRLLATMVGCVARAIPHRFGPYLKLIAPYVLQALSQVGLDEMLRKSQEDGTVDLEAEELKEAALITLEDFLSSCVADMRPFTDEALEASIRYLSYDPSMVADSDDEMDGTQEADLEDDSEPDFEPEEDFEEEEALSDTDDSSWKIRRCAAKSLHTMISTRSIDFIESGVLYDKIAPFLVKRFTEREENVRLEVLSTMTLLVTKTAETAPVAISAIAEAMKTVTSQTFNPRKRPRGESDASLFDETFAMGAASPGQTPSPTLGARAELARLGPSIIKNAVKLFSQKDLSTKQGATVLLRVYANMKHGGLTDSFGQLIEPVMSIIGATGAFVRIPSGISGSAASATGNSLRMESLHFLQVICETHSSHAIGPYLGSIVSGVVSAIEDKYFRISCQAIEVSEGVIKVLTPPRSIGMDERNAVHVKTLYDAISYKAKANDADLEVRQRAIHALGVCLIRTATVPNLLPPYDKTEALSILEERLKNETTRLASVEAVDAVATYADIDSGLGDNWIQSVALELASQLRKADIRLRAASLGALEKLAANPGTLLAFNDDTVQFVRTLLLPLFDAGNLSTLGHAMNIMTNLAKKAPRKVVSTGLDNAICAVVVTPLSGTTLEALLGLVEAIGAQGVGKLLMQGLLQKVGVKGDPAIVGSAIGTLIVSGGSSVGVGISDIVTELRTAEDDQRKCLALCILGEVGLRLGANSSLDPQLFLNHFNSKSEQIPRVAAVSLGRAGAGNLTLYLPIIISNLKAKANTQTLILHSVKEMLQHASRSKMSTSDYSDVIWEEIMKISGSEDNKAIGAECIGTLVGFNPKKYLLSLQTYLNGPVASARGLVIQAVRFALGDTNETLDETFKATLTQLLVTMLSDTNIENRRLALTTLNSAIKHKPLLIIPHLQQLLPFVIEASKVDGTLVREVQMGPFKHKVDDGLENRKSAYETLHALISTAYARLNRHDIFQRVIEGLRDEHEIKMLCNLMLTKLITIDPDETVRRLDSVGQSFQETLITKMKDNAVRQEVEKAQEAAKDILRTTVRLNSNFPAASVGTGHNQSPLWRNYWEFVNKDFRPQLKAANEEVKLQA